MKVGNLFWSVGLLGLAGVWAQSAFAAMGVVDTRDGQRHEGFIRLNLEGVTVIKPEEAAVRTVDLTNLQSLWFRSRPSFGLGSASGVRDAGNAHWMPVNVGSGTRGGISFQGREAIRLAGSGTNILGRRDSFHFTQVLMNGNGEIAARLLQFDPGSEQARTGLMLREGLEAGARNVFLGLTPQGVVAQWRGVRDGETRVERMDASWPWLRLKRVGDEVFAYTSRAGIQWRLLRRFEMPLSRELQIGLAVSGQESGKLPMAATRATQAMFDRIQQGRQVRYHAHTPQVSLKSGSTKSGEIDSADHRNVRFVGAHTWDTVPVREVSRIDFYWVPTRLDHLVRGDQSGVLLSSGEFVEGQFRGLEEGVCVISSVLFGLKRFAVDGEVLSVVLGRPHLPSGAFEVKTWSGSTWRGMLMAMDDDGVELREESMGRVVIPLYDLKAIARRTSG